MKTIALCCTLISTALITPAFSQTPAAPAKPATDGMHSANTPAHRLSAGWWKKRHEQKLAQAKGKECDLLFIGDSITHGWEGAGKKTWQKYYAARKPFNIGFSGDRTQHVLWRLDQGEMASFKPKVAVIMIGTNNTGHQMQKAQETADGIKAIIGRIHKLSPKTKILLLGVFPRGANPDHKMRIRNNEINAIIKGYHDGEKVHFLDISSTFLNKEGVLTKEVMPDYLHPRQHGYKLWAEAMEPTLKKLLGE